MSSAKIICRIILISVAAILGVGCANLRTASEINYSVSLDDPERVHFRGKGAAAGVMMMSSMGPVGIAIGVAIDEGVAKEIQSALDKAGCERKSLIEFAFQEAARKQTKNAVKRDQAFSSSVANVKIAKLGFVLDPGEAELAVAEIEGSIFFREKNYSFSSNIAHQTPVPLKVLRSEGGEACGALRQALEQSFAKWCDEINLCDSAHISSF